MNTVNPVALVCNTISSAEMQAKIDEAIRGHQVSKERFTRTTLIAIQQNPKIVDCDKNSLYNAILSAATMGLVPDGKQGVITDFNTNVGTRDNPQWVKKAVFMPMVEGIVYTLGRAGITAYAASVHENDFIEFTNDDEGQHVLHKPKVFSDRGKFVGVFAAAKLKDGTSYFEAMDLDAIEKVRSKSKQKDKDGNPTGSWKEFPERMAQKSALHRLKKRLPIIDEQARNLPDDEDELYDFTGDGQKPPVEAEKPKDVTPASKRPKALQAVVDSVKVPEPEIKQPEPIQARAVGDEYEEVF